MNHQDKPLHCDYAIVGAGASGLFLACEMLAQGLLEHKSLCIIEKEANKGNDRTWCFWHAGELDPLLEACVSHKWTAHRFGDQDAALAPYTYYHIRSSDFYSLCSERLSANVGVQFIHESCHSISTSEGGCTLQLDSGNITAAYAFHANLLNRPSLNSPMFWQSFYGWRLRFTTPLKSPLPLRIMDFNVEQGGQVQFVYCLPFTDNEVLVELTTFGLKTLDEAAAQKWLTDYLNGHGREWEIEEVEIGKIPMSQALDNSDRWHPKETRCIPIGMAAGAIKPTTGYAFLQMHAHARQLVSALRQNKPLPTVYRRKRFRLYDSLLLSILEREPDRGKPIFLRLFTRQPVSRILKFLDERTILIEELRIFVTLPIALFLRYLARHVFIRK